MCNRSKHLPVYTLLIGLLIISFATNILFYNRILILQDFVSGINPWISTPELESIKKEINWLSNQKYTNHKYDQYDIKTKEPIINNLFPKK
jgi:hypothetical protein